MDKKRTDRHLRIIVALMLVTIALLISGIINDLRGDSQPQFTEQTSWRITYPPVTER
jgi:hypothetical protein